jgi:IclR family KDG regulon transcriptional repressor
MKDETPKEEPRDYRIAAIDRAVSVVEALAEEPAQGVTSLAERLGLTKSLVFRILRTLEGRGVVVRDPDRAEYSLGFRMSLLGDRAARQNGLLFAAHPIMDDLQDATGENVNLVVRDGTKTMVIATREGRHSMRLFAHPGRHGPLHAGGGSQLLLAFAPPELRDAVLAAPLKRYTPRTVTDPAALARRLARIVEQGWNIAQDDLDEGAFSVAAPIRGIEDEVVAAISVAGPVARLDEERRHRNLAAAREAAERISQSLMSGPAEPHWADA